MRTQFATFILVLVALISYSQALEPFGESTLQQRSSSEGGWFDLSVGVRMKRDENSLSMFQKRDQSHPTTPVMIKRSPETGKLVWPRNYSEALRMVQRDVPELLRNSLHRRMSLVRRAMRVKITWYTGHDLLNPACIPESANWAPTDESHVAAVTIDWPGKPQCGNFVKIQHATNKKKHVIVRVVDSCGGCPPGEPHIDLTKAAFEKLYDEDVGMVEGLKAKVIACPRRVEDNWSDQVIARYGPKEVIQGQESDN